MRQRSQNRASRTANSLCLNSVDVARAGVKRNLDRSSTGAYRQWGLPRFRSDGYWGGGGSPTPRLKRPFPQVVIRKLLGTDPVYFGNNVLNEHAATVLKVEMLLYGGLRCIVWKIGTDVSEESTSYIFRVWRRVILVDKCRFGGTCCFSLYSAQVAVCCVSDRYSLLKEPSGVVIITTPL